MNKNVILVLLILSFFISCGYEAGNLEIDDLGYVTENIGDTIEDIGEESEDYGEDLSDLGNNLEDIGEEMQDLDENEYLEFKKEVCDKTNIVFYNPTFNLEKNSITFSIKNGESYIEYLYFGIEGRTDFISFKELVKINHYETTDLSILIDEINIKEYLIDDNLKIEITPVVREEGIEIACPGKLQTLIFKNENTNKNKCYIDNIKLYEVTANLYSDDTLELVAELENFGDLKIDDFSVSITAFDKVLFSDFNIDLDIGKEKDIIFKFKNVSDYIGNNYLIRDIQIIPNTHKNCTFETLKYTQVPINFINYENDICDTTSIKIHEINASVEYENELIIEGILTNTGNNYITGFELTLNDNNMQIVEIEDNYFSPGEINDFHFVINQNANFIYEDKIIDKISIMPIINNNENLNNECDNAAKTYEDLKVEYINGEYVPDCSDLNLKIINITPFINENNKLEFSIIVKNYGYVPVIGFEIGIGNKDSNENEIYDASVKFDETQTLSFEFSGNTSIFTINNIIEELAILPIYDYDGYEECAEYAIDFPFFKNLTIFN